MEKSHNTERSDVSLIRDRNFTYSPYAVGIISFAGFAFSLRSLRGMLYFFLAKAQGFTLRSQTNKSTWADKFCGRYVTYKTGSSAIKKKRLFSIFMLLFLFLIVHPSQSYSEGKIKVGIDEQLGHYIPLNTKFQTSEGKTVALKDIITKPTILALVYYECPGLCSPMQSELAWTIDKIQLEPGQDFQVISLSFDPRETSEIAARWKRSYLQTIKRKFDPKDWIFLTGDSIDIKNVTDACGFHYIPAQKDFVHASTVITISPDGKICRYLFGIDFNPFDMKMALLEAGSGKTNPTIAKVLRMCFSYDPNGDKYSLDVTRITGALIVLGAGIFLAVLLFKKKKIRTKEFN